MKSYSIVHKQFSMLTYFVQEQRFSIFIYYNQTNKDKNFQILVENVYKFVDIFMTIVKIEIKKNWKQILSKISL